MSVYKYLTFETGNGYKKLPHLKRLSKHDFQLSIDIFDRTEIDIKYYAEEYYGSSDHTKSEILKMLPDEITWMDNRHLASIIFSLNKKNHINQIIDKKSDLYAMELYELYYWINWSVSFEKFCLPMQKYKFFVDKKKYEYEIG